MTPIRILIIDDSAVMCRLLADVLESNPLIQIVGTACNGAIGLSKIKELSPDLVILDIQMPVMDGLAALKHLRPVYPKLPVIMFSSLTGRGSTATFEALALGASDYVEKPGAGVPPSQVVERVRGELLPKIRSLFPPPKLAISEPVAAPAARHVQKRVDVIAIGVSTGGPNALSDLFSRLPERLPVPVVVVQHMPAVFTHMLAERLNTLSEMEVIEGKCGEQVRSGSVYIAPGGHHMLVTMRKGGASINLNTDAPENSCRPSVDVLFRSVAELYRANALGLVLTGMGSDGSSGAKAIRDAGGEIWVQDRDSSVVWGMPGSVVAAGYAHRICPLEQIASNLIERLSLGRSPIQANTAHNLSPVEVRS